jgi:hypothetical protein
MSDATARVRTARAQLAAVAVAAAALWGGAVALAVFAIAAVADVAFALPLSWRAGILPLAGFAAFLAATFVLWRSRQVLSLPDVSLWIEERVPSLRYSLVTAVDQGAQSTAALERVVAAHRWDVELARAAARSVIRPLIPLVLAMVTLLLLPSGAISRVIAPATGDSIDRAARGPADLRSLLTPLTATIRPPAYARGAERVLEEPAVLEALPGGMIVLRGRGDPSRVSAQIGERTVHASGGRDRWQMELSVPRQPLPLLLTDGRHRRLLTLEPLADDAPRVTLSVPARDTVMRAGRGAMALEAYVRDDYGVDRAAFELIVSSGGGELFRFRTATLGARAGAGARQLALRATLPLDSLSLQPGDIVHLRTVAFDANDVTGPGMGISDTRTIRIARADEYDTVSVEGAPPPDIDADAVSQRMLIIHTERLEAQRRRLTRDSLVSVSRQLAQRQNGLRRQVAEIVFMRLGMQPDAEHSHGPGDGHDHTGEELSALLTPDRLLQEAGAAISAQGLAGLGGHGHDESPILNINQPLLEAYNHMWEASGELEIGEPARALPPMRRALEALQRAREAERYYVRGRAPRVVVDIARVRLASPQSVTPAERTNAPAADSPRARLAARLLSAIELLARDPQPAVDSLLMVRLEALRVAPDATPALADAVAALRGGRDATESLVRARRAVDGDTRTTPTSAWWRGGW